MRHFYHVASVTVLVAVMPFALVGTLAGGIAHGGCFVSHVLKLRAKSDPKARQAAKKRWTI